MNENNLLNTIDFQDGKITYNSCDIRIDIPLSMQLNELNEDILQVEYNNNFLLDVGWRPYFNSEDSQNLDNGRFIVSVIHYQDWESPVKLYEPRTIEDLKSSIISAIEFINQINSN